MPRQHARRRPAARRDQGVDGTGQPAVGRRPGHDALRPPPPSWFERAIDRAGVEAGPALSWWAWMMSLGLLAVVSVLLGGVALMLLATLAGLLAPLAVLRARRGQGDLRLERALPAALEAAARSLRSGASLRLAIAE